MGFKGTRKSHSKGKTFSAFAVFAAPDFYKLLVSLKLASEGAILISKIIVYLFAISWSSLTFYHWLLNSIYSSNLFF